MARKFMQGIFKPINPHKYKGDVNNIIYRSSWELKALSILDLDPNVIQYSSEEIIVNYRDFQGKSRRYFPDLYVKRKVGDEIVEQLIEIKPFKETQPPKVEGRKKTQALLNEVLTWDMNSRKWAAAEIYAAKRGWQFVKLTEYELGIVKGKSKAFRRF